MIYPQPSTTVYHELEPRVLDVVEADLFISAYPPPILSSIGKELNYL
jgi:hypothetical protein